MPVRAEVVCVPFVAALVTPFQMAAERRRPMARGTLGRVDLVAADLFRT
jgi:hypothetical protein